MLGDCRWSMISTWTKKQFNFNKASIMSYLYFLNGFKCVVRYAGTTKGYCFQVPFTEMNGNIK